ncbi:hypothetical protein ACFQ3N_19335 [Virgibacillus byunsanensis]|uniref:Lipoprotein n=1 Tax=Virgibacillus byunsanensis TaxID=570945 RepID=A0ABW3LSN4_9BACI
MNRKKILLGVAGLVLLIVVSSFVMNAENKEDDKDVTEHNYTYVGESENWTAEFEFEGKETFYEEDGTNKYNAEHNSRFVLTYKGDLSELSALEKIRYGYETPSNATEIGTTFDEPPSEKIFTINDSGSSIVYEDSVIEATVEWGGEKETFELKNDD